MAAAFFPAVGRGRGFSGLRRTKRRLGFSIGRCRLLLGTMGFLAYGFAGLSTAARAEERRGLRPFGIGSCHINNRSVEDLERWLPKMRDLGLKYYRTGPTSWPEMEPEPGKWRWKELEEHREYLKRHGFQAGGLLLGNPSWNTADAPGSLPVNHLAGWSAYVTAMVRHGKKEITHWEVWNEPPNFTGKDQTPADYAKIVVSAWKAAKAEDPGCLIGLAAKSAHLTYLAETIRAGAKDHFDYITLHPYEVLDGIAGNAGTEASFMNIVPSVRRMLRSVNPEKADVPVIFTELGCDIRKGPEVQGQALVKAYTMGIAQGVACIHWFEGMDGDSGDLGLLDRKGNPRPAASGIEQLIRWLGQHPRYLGWMALNGRHAGFLFEGPQGKVLVAWARPGAEGDPEVSFSREVKTVNPLDGTSRNTVRLKLTPAPVFVINPPGEIVREVLKNVSRPLALDGDFRHARSVSLEVAGNGIAGQGLRSLSGDSLAEAVAAYGGSARSGAIPHGNAFTVDPQFLSWDRVPIEIEAVVRRNEANDNSGFKLIYESAEGFKTAGGWYTIPDNREWYTVKWHIADPQFVNYWGYNFALESDGDVYNKYYLKSLKVTRLDK